MTRVAAQKAHAKRRAYQRFGLKLNSGDLSEMVQMIQKQQAWFIKRTSNTRTLWRMNIKAQPMVAVYDSKRKTIATVMYEKWHNPYTIYG